MNDDDKGRSSRRRLIIVLVAAAALLIYAYAIQVTQVDLQEPLEPQRQENLVGLLRQLARPDIFSFENVTESTTISLQMPCPEELRGAQVTSGTKQVVLAPNCATTTQDVLRLTGEGFPSNVRGAVFWRPLGDTVPRRLTEFRANSQGSFAVSFTMPDIRPSEEPQQIEVVELLSRRIVGFSDISKITFSRIIETILMALMASTIGTILAVPISFLAARNLMSDVSSPLAAIMAALIALPVFGFLAYLAGKVVLQAAVFLSDPLLVGVVAFPVSIALIWPVLRLGQPLTGTEVESYGSRALSALRLLAASLLFFLGLAILAEIGVVVGAWLEENLGLFAFVGNFIYVVADFGRVLLPGLMGFAGALLGASYASRYAQEAVIRLPEGSARLVTAILTFLGTSILVFALAYALNWICIFGLCQYIPQETSQLVVTLGVPALLVGAAAAFGSMFARPKRPYPVGTVTYTITRGSLNLLRAIEPVILGFVLVVWVGLGPFAGVMALMLASIADLGKLFSEQVENIDQGPIEAVTATGANRLQTVVFAVIPQIVPHYIAFTFYRWDINVRLSTIIGFVGGGGIGLILFRSANLTQYRQASVMVISIAVVVSVLDYVSSRVRKRII